MSKYVGDQPLGIVASGEWPETLAGGQFKELNEMYSNFLNKKNAMVQLCFKRLGIYSFGGFGASADTEGNAALFDNDGGDMTFDTISKIRNSELADYMVIPINPEEIQVNYQINTTTYQTIFFSELASISGLKLRRFKIDSFFPYTIDSKLDFGTEPIYRPQDYIKWITDCMDNKVILAFKAFGQLAEPLPYMKCFIENFESTLRANGEVRYSLSICEYIDYRANIDNRMFAMSDDTLIVSPKENKRNEGAIGLGDLVYVVKGMVYTDKLKNSTLNVSNVINSFFRLPPAMVSTRMLYGAGKDEFSKSFHVYEGQDLANSVIYNLANMETIEYIAELIRSKVKTDYSEMWLVVGGDYFSKFRNVDLSVVQSVPQMVDLYKNMSPQSMSHNIKLRSMRDNRIGWADLKQLKKVRM